MRMPISSFLAALVARCVVIVLVSHHVISLSIGHEETTVGESTFAVFPADPDRGNITYDECRSKCAWWKPRGYLATVLNVEENNALLMLVRHAGVTEAFLGSKRGGDRWFRWIEGPLGRRDSGRGEKICENTYSGHPGNGSCPCASATYCNFTVEGNSSYPDNLAGLQWVVYMSNRTGTWDDTGLVSFGCACRHDVFTGTRTTLPTETEVLTESAALASSTKTAIASDSIHSLSHTSALSETLSRLTLALSPTSSLWATSTATLTHSFAQPGPLSTTPTLSLSAKKPSASVETTTITSSPTPTLSWRADIPGLSFSVTHRISTSAELVASASLSLLASITDVDSSPTPTASVSHPLVMSSRSGTSFTDVTRGVVASTVVVVIASGDISGSSSVALLSIMTCNPTTPPVSPITALAISPFYYNGELWMAVGNLVLLFLFAALHATVTFGVSRARSVTFFDACQQVCRFPALSLQLMDVYLPGAARGAVLLLANDRVPLVVSGISCLCAAVFVMVLCVVVAFRYVLPRAGWESYDHSDRGAAWDACFYPEGRWLPQGHRSAWGPLMTTMVYRWGRLASAQRIMTVLLAVASGLHGRSACGGALFLLGAAHVALAAVFVWLKPHRLPMNRFLVPAAHLVSACVCFLRGTPGNISPADLSSVTDTLALALQGVYGLLHAWKCLAALWIAHREAQWSEVGKDTREALDFRMSSRRSLRSAWQAWWYGCGGAGRVDVPVTERLDDEAALQAILHEEEVEMLLLHDDAGASFLREERQLFPAAAAAEASGCCGFAVGDAADEFDYDTHRLLVDMKDLVIADVTAEPVDPETTEPSAGAYPDGRPLGLNTDFIPTVSNIELNSEALVLLHPTLASSTQVCPVETPPDNFHELQVLYNSQQDGQSSVSFVELETLSNDHSTKATKSANT